MSDTPARSLLSVAIEQENWELAALCLLAGMTEAARLLPPDAVEALLEELAGEPESPKPCRRAGAGAVDDAASGPGGTVKAENFYGHGAALADRLELARAHAVEGWITRSRCCACG